MNNSQLPPDKKDDFEDILAKYRAKNDKEIAELKGNLELEIAKVGDKFVDFFPSSLMMFFPADDLKAAAVGARYGFQCGLYYLRCARDEYKRIHSNLRKDSWDNSRY